MPYPLPPLYRPLNAIVFDANFYRDKLNEMKLTLKIVVLDEDYWLLLAMSVEVLANNKTESSVHCGNVTQT